MKTMETLRDAPFDIWDGGGGGVESMEKRLKNSLTPQK